tara:strand:+ start:1865 stop:2278 length:414 start_codon:yes stop_codon:yes gene_type:complete
MNTITNKTIMVVAMLICKVVHKVRCQSFLRRVEDFSYEVKPLKGVNNLPFFKKQIIVSNDWEKSTALKIGDVCIKYSFDTLVKYRDVRDTEITEPEFNENVAIALARTTVQTHASTNVVKLESRKGNNERAIHKSSL